MQAHKSVLLVVVCLFVPIFALSGSKLAVHTSFTGGGPGTWNVIQTGKPRLVKLLDSFENAAKIKQVDPGITIVGRIYLADQPIGGDPVGAAQNWWNQHKQTIMAFPAVDYWEGYNEPDPGQIQWLTQMEIERMKLLASAGKKAVIFNWATGTPDVTNPATIQAMYPAFDTAKQFGAILGLHEYSAPYLNSTYSGDSCSGEGWLTGRYRKLYKNFLIPAGKAIPLVITEHGIDCGTCAVTGCKCSGGWKAACPSWNSPNCPATYMSMLQWYDSLIKCDAFVIGATIFSLEIPGWDSFDIAELVPQFSQYLGSH